MEWTDWAPLLRLPGVATVVYARSNFFKLVLSRFHVQVLVDLCHSHKTQRAKQTSCMAAHKNEISRPTDVSAERLARYARSEGGHFVDLLEGARKAANRPLHVVYYERLQRDAKREIGRLFSRVGLDPAKVAAPASSSLKITSDDLRLSLKNFSGVEAELAREDPDFLDQLRDTEHKVFKYIHLPGGNGRFFSDFES